ncbi:MAG TPA: hypothetical protein VF457_15700 [Burkholderiaceae bacterium]
MTRRPPPSTLCTAPGCTRAWTQNFGRPLCSEHAAQFRAADDGRPRQQPLAGVTPLREAVRPFSELGERE